jgi:hypothetical protein
MITVERVSDQVFRVTLPAEARSAEARTGHLIL